MAKVPRWQQIATSLRDRINTGYYVDEFPGELRVAEEFGVSRGTARAALRPLREEGLISSGRGKKPHVSQTKTTSRFGEIYSLKEVIEDGGYESTNRVLQQAVVANERVAEQLRLDGDTPLFRLERVRMAGQTPLAYEEIFLPASLAAPLSGVSFKTAALYEQLRDLAGVVITGGKEETRAIAAPGEVSELLDCPAGSPLLLIERIGCSGNGPVEYRRTMFEGSRFRSSRTFGQDAGFDLSGAEVTLCN